MESDHTPLYNHTTELQLWNRVRSYVDEIGKIYTQVTATEERIEEVRLDLAALLDIDADGTATATAELEDKKQLLVSLWQKLKDRTNEEQATLEKALESLGVLSAVRMGSSHEESSLIDLSNKRKKRRTDSSPPLPPSNTTPAPRGPSPASSSRSSVLRAGSQESAGTAAAIPSATIPSLKRNQSGNVKTERPGNNRRNTLGKDAPPATTATSAASNTEKLDPARARRETLSAQLPLAKGRRVAFRQPSKSKGGGSSHSNAPSPSLLITGDEEGETWILAVITECINNDRNRYVVQDAEDDSTPTFNTTLKAIVPLPESCDTLPEKDYKPGSHVLALYPDTSCFYRAVVKGGGPKMEHMNRKQREKRQQELLNAKYQLEFEDDGGQITSVPANLVVQGP